MGIFFQSRKELLTPEIRPQGVHKDKFGIGRLPQKVVTEAFLP